MSAASSAAPGGALPAEWVGRGDVVWTVEGMPLESGLPGLLLVPVAGSRQRGLLCTGEDPAVVAAWTAFVEDGRGLGLPVPRQLDAVASGERLGVVIEQLDATLIAWWSTDPGVGRLGELVGALATFVDGVHTALGKSTEALAAARIHLGGLVRTQRGRIVFGPASLMPASPAECTAPEQVFGADAPAAGLAGWQLGELLFWLVVAPPERLAGGRLAPTQRSRLIADLHRTRPRLFAHRPLDPREFLYPERLPEQDRAALTTGFRERLPGGGVAASLLAESCARLLDDALAIDPARRAAGLPRLADGLRSLEVQLDAAGAEGPGDEPAATPPPAAEATPVPPPPRSSTAAWIASLVVVSLLSLGVGLVLGRLSAPAPTVAIAPPPVRAAPAALVTEDVPVEPDRGEPTAITSPAADEGPSRSSARRKGEDATPRPRSSSAPRTEPADEPEVAVNMGSVSIEGGTCRLVAEDGAEQGCGAVPVGRYAVWARPAGGAEIALGSHVVRTGQSLRIKCGFGTCRLR